MARYPLFGTGKQGKSVTASSQKLLNLWPEISEKPDRSVLTLYNTPGLIERLDFGNTPARGMHAVETLLYVVHRGTFWEVNNSFTKTSRGTINTTTGQVAISDNGNQVMIVDGVNGWIFNRTTLAFTQIVSANFPNGATICVFADAFFLVDDPANPGRFRKSATFDGLTWAALDFATAEYSSDPLVNVIPHQGFIGLLGSLTIEAWQNVGSVNFPYQRVSGAVIEWGLAAKFSVAKYDNSFIFLAQNRLGGRQVVIIENFLPRVISGPEFDFDLASYTTVADAVAFSYFQGGHSFYHISFPLAGKSWVFDLSSENWTEVQSSGGRHRPNLGVFFINRIIASDYSNGKLYEFTENSLDDNGAMITRELTCKHINFDNRSSISSLWLDVQPGVGAAGANPQIELFVSKDGGNTYGVGRPVSLGKTGEYLQRARWSRVARAYDIVPKFRLTDVAKLVITGAYLNTSYD